RMRIDVAREGAERAVRHADRERGRVLERIRHRQQQNPHGVIYKSINSTARAEEMKREKRKMGSGGHSWGFPEPCRGPPHSGPKPRALASPRSHVRGGTLHDKA